MDKGPPTRWRLAGWAVLTVLIVGAGLIRLTSGEDEGEASPESSIAETTLPPDLDTADLDGLSFVDVTADAGLDSPHSSRTLLAEDAMTSGAAVADVDSDGFDDIYLTRVGLPNLLYLNNGDGTFTDGADAAGVQGLDVEAGSSGAGFADIEGDGDLDLYVSSAGRAQNVLYVNDGNGAFTDETSTRGLTLPALPEDGRSSFMHSVTWGDVNNDGFMDLLTLQWFTDVFVPDAVEVATDEIFAETGEAPAQCPLMEAIRALDEPTATEPRSRLFLNDGTGSFSDVGEEMGVAFDEIAAFTGQFADIDGDDWLDLALTGDGCTSRLYRNIDGERFEDVTAEAGVGTDENGMGSVIFDIDGDGLPDWFITSISYETDDGTCPSQGSITGCSGNRLYLNNGDGTFDDATDEWGVRNGGWGWGAAFEDFSGSGSGVLVMTNGYNNPSTNSGANGAPASPFFEPFDDDPINAWVQTTDGTADAAADLGLTDSGVGHALVPLDFDNDGVLDLLVANVNGQPVLYRGQKDSDYTSLIIGLEDPTRPGNPSAVGARVEVTLADGDDPIVKWVTTDGSYESQKPADVWFGLGESSGTVHRIEVFWPGSGAPTVLDDIELDEFETTSAGSLATTISRA